MTLTIPTLTCLWKNFKVQKIIVIPLTYEVLNLIHVYVIQISCVGDLLGNIGCVSRDF